jgi:hypothetical protein
VRSMAFVLVAGNFTLTLRTPYCGYSYAPLSPRN